jgi:Fe-S cluster biogenesis protein NfuA
MVFSDEDLYEAVKNFLPQVSEYVSSHGGGLELLGVKDGVVYIRLIGACGGCSMSLMTTKMVVQRKLRELIHPELMVENVDVAPEGTYRG